MHFNEYYQNAFDDWTPASQNRSYITYVHDVAENISHFFAIDLLSVLPYTKHKTLSYIYDALKQESAHEEHAAVLPPFLTCEASGSCKLQADSGKWMVKIATLCRTKRDLEAWTKSTKCRQQTQFLSLALTKNAHFPLPLDIAENILRENTIDSYRKHLALTMPNHPFIHSMNVKDYCLLTVFPMLKLFSDVIRRALFIYERQLKELQHVPLSQDAVLLRQRIDYLHAAFRHCIRPDYMSLHFPVLFCQAFFAPLILHP